MKKGLFAWFLAMGSVALADEGAAIEADVKLAFERAMEKLPEPLREQVADVQLKRAGDLGLGDDLPLEYRLLNRAAYASFSVLKRTLTVYDAGALAKPTWEGAGPSKDEVAMLLAGVADVLGVKAPRNGKDPTFEMAWQEFVKRVYSWSGEKVPKTFPEVEDAKVWDRFLTQGVWRLMDGKVPMEQLMIHELGHALQLERELGSLAAKMKYWASLSGYTETFNGEATDGFAGGMNKTEEAMVLIRLLLTVDPAQMSRGSKADYEAAEGARFVNRYARYDLREDYAESFRLMACDPERLVQAAPEKFLYLNALGWNARLDSKAPGPLWYSGAEFERLFPKEERLEIFERLLGKDGKGPALHPVALGAVLRAHAEELEAKDLPRSYELLKLPDDLPEEMRKELDGSHLKAMIDGEVYVASPEWQKARQDDAIDRWIGSYDFELGMLKFRGRGGKGIRGGYDEGVVKLKNANQRARRYEVLREFGGALLTFDEWRELDRKEADFHEKAGSEWYAARFALLGSNEKLEVLFAKLEGAVDSEVSGFERSQLIGTGADVAMRSKDAGLIHSKVKEIPGETLGAWLRVKYLLRAAEVTGDESFSAAAKAEVEGCEYPKLKKQLGLLLEVKGK